MTFRISSFFELERSTTQVPAHLGPGRWVPFYKPARGPAGWTRLCEATRKDGMPCCKPANRQTGVCSKHHTYRNLPYRPSSTNRYTTANLKARQARVGQTWHILAARPKEIEELREFQILREGKAARRAADLVDAYRSQYQLGDMVGWAARRDEIMRGYYAAVERDQARKERWYREREIAGMPHPEDMSRW
jgi:hypothetical protein